VTIYVSLSGLSTFRRAKLLSVGLEEIRKLLRMLMCDVMKGQSGDVIGLACLDQLVVLEEVLLLGVVAVGLFLEDALGFRSKKFLCQKKRGYNCCARVRWQWNSLRGNVFKFHRNVQRLTRSSSKFFSSS